MPSGPADSDGFVKPLRLPKDLVATGNAMGLINLNPDVGESDGARWFMTEAETVPYTPELDRLIPVGTIVPGVIVSGEYSGDRADVRPVSAALARSPVAFLGGTANHNGHAALSRAGTAHRSR